MAAWLLDLWNIWIESFMAREEQDGSANQSFDHDLFSTSLQCAYCRTLGEKTLLTQLPS